MFGGITNTFLGVLKYSVELQISLTFIIIGIQLTLDISKLIGLFFTSSNYAKCKLIQIDASNLHNSRYPSSRYRESTVYEILCRYCSSGTVALKRDAL